MKSLTIPQPIPTVLDEPSAAQLSAEGHWAETQVILSIKDANLRREDPDRVLHGQEPGGIFHPVAPVPSGKLVTPRRSLGSRLRRFFGYLKA